MSLPGFQKLSKNVYATTPAESSDSRTEDPDVVLLYTWLGAEIKNITKYISGYRKIYPSSRIILTRTEFLDMIISPKTAERNSVPSINAIFEGHEYEFSKNPPRILVHVWSNGGAYSFQAACTAYGRQNTTKFKPDLLILDSTPGSDRFAGSYSKAVSLMNAVLPKTWLMRLFGYGYAMLFVFALFILPRLRGYRSLPVIIRSSMNDPTVVPLSCPRAYIYSDGDTLIESDQVERHGKDAIDKGYQVELIPFKNTQHVAHMRADPDLYWSHVTRKWNERGTRR